MSAAAMSAPTHSLTLNPLGGPSAASPSHSPSAAAAAAAAGAYGPPVPAAPSLALVPISAAASAAAASAASAASAAAQDEEVSRALQSFCRAALAPDAGAKYTELIRMLTGRHIAPSTVSRSSLLSAANSYLTRTLSPFLLLTRQPHCVGVCTCVACHPHAQVLHTSPPFFGPCL
jgi:hypothetical protein